MPEQIVTKYLYVSVQQDTDFTQLTKKFGLPYPLGKYS